MSKENEGNRSVKFRNAPTGNEANVTGILIDRISSGKIEEEWVDYDTLHLMQQIGGVP